MLDLDEYTEHLEMAWDALVGQDNYGETITRDDHKVHHHGAYEIGPQVIVVDSLELGGREVDTIVIIGFYIPHDGQCTVAINHMDGIKTIDNADLMFPAKEED